MATTGGPLFMMIAFYFYSAIICTMGWRAAARLNYKSESLSSQIIALVAALTFISSDSMTAYNYFYLEIPNGGTWIVITYWIAQYLFLFSLLRIPSDYEPLDKSIN
jgi:uncharacterized membrane protein YhhN